MPEEIPDSSSDSAPAPEEAAAAETESFAPSVKDIQAILPQYEIIDKIGAGGMGAVYKARQPSLDRIVAIKILPSGTDDKFHFKERFRREAKAMARLQHPGIITVFEFGEAESNDNEPLLYIVMEYVEGADLNYLIKSGALEMDQVLVVVSQICEALQYAHNENIVHRDIKPANIMLNLDGNVKIADFGLAKILSTDTSPELSLTQSELVMGTIDYLAPEQMEAGAKVDQRADLYALGVVIYEMLTGKAPRGAFVLPSEKQDGLDPRVDRLVLRAMATEPSDRFQSADELSTAILSISTPDTVEDIEENKEETSKPETADAHAAPETPWQSDTAKPMPIPKEQQPATQADIQAAVEEATRVATEAATRATQVRMRKKASSSFWPNLFALAKSLMIMGVILLFALVLGLIAWAKWPQIAQALKRSDAAPTQQTGKEQKSAASSPSYSSPTASSLPQQTATTLPKTSSPSTSSPTTTTPSTTRPPHPPPGFPPPRGKRPPPRKR